MKRKFTLLIAALALLTMIVQPGRVWGQTTSTSSLIFTAACGGSGTADDGAVWTVTSDGTESNFDNNKGIHYGTGSAQVKYITLTTSDISGTITNIVVNASVASGVSAVLNVTVGGNDFGTQGQSTSTTPTDYTFTGSASGEIVVTHTKPAKAAKALYLKSIIVTYTTGGGSTTYTVTYNANGANSGDVPTDSNEYSSGEAATVLGNTGNLAKTGNTWSGWIRTIGDEPKTYAAGDTLIIKANTTLLAKWTANTHNVTMPAADTYGSYTASATENVLYGTTVTLTYTPAQGYEGYTATWSANNTPLAGNTFTMPDEDVTVSVEVAPYEQPTTVYIDMNYQWLGSTNGGNLSPDQLPVIKIDDNVTTTITDGTSTHPRGDTDYIRIYKGSTLTFAAPDGYNITQIVFTTGGNNTWNAPSVSSGTLSYKTWTGNAESVTFTLSGNCFISMAAIDLGQSSLPTPTVTIDANGITNTNVFTGTDAGSLSALVTYEDTPVEGASVTWSGNNDAVATIHETTGAVTLVAAGSVTFTATFAGNASYNGASKNYDMTVTNFDPDAPGTQNNPYTVAQARAAIDAGTGVTGVYVTGIVYEGGSNLSDGAINYWISDDGTETDKFEIYKGKSFSGNSFSSTNEVQPGDVVVVSGDITKYNSTYEFSAGSTLQSLKLVAPTFSPAAGSIASGSKVTITDLHTVSTTIYYTTDGTDPTTSSNTYSAAITVNQAMTIRAIAVKANCTNSDIASAAYTVTAAAIAPTLEPAGGLVVAGATVTMSTTTEGATIYYTTDGNNPTTSSTQYTAPVVINENMTIKAIAVADGYNNSSVTTGTYVVVAHAGTALDPYTVADARIAIDANMGMTGVYVTGIVCTGGSNLNSGSLIYWISDDGTETNKFEIYKGKSFSGNNFSATSDIQIGDVVVVSGDITKYNSTYEFSQGSTLQSLKLVAPTFSPVAGEVASGTAITISDLHTDATIYYTTDGTEPTNESTEYDPENKPTITATTTLKAIATKENCDNSAVASAAYTVTAPVASITVAPTTVNATAAETDGTLTVTYTNITTVVAEVYFCDANGDAATYDWLDAEINNDKNVYYAIDANTGAARTAYLKVSALDDNTEIVYSDLVTINQAAHVVDYATLPFNWAGGASADFLALAGCSASALSSDYAAGNAPYLIKFDADGKYLQVKTDSRPEQVTIGVKMIGGDNTSTITVKASVDGETFDDGEALTISGSQNDIVNLETTRSFGSDVRYIKMVFTKGSNVGVGPISITKYVPKYAVNLNQPQQGQGTIASDKAEAVEGETVTLTATPNTGYAFESWTVLDGEAQVVTVTNNTFVMPASNVEVEATFTTLPKHNIVIPTAIENNVIVDATNNQAYANETVTITVDAPNNKVLATLTVTGNTSTNNITIAPEVSPYVDEYTFTMPDEDVAINATFTDAPSFTVSFSVNGSIDNNLEVSVTQGQSTPLPTNSTLTPEGFSITGWASSNGSTEAVADPYTPTANITLFAILGQTIPHSLVINASTPNFPTSYGTANTFTEYNLAGKNFKIQQGYKNGSILQWRASGHSNGTGTMYNSEDLGKINTIILVYHSSDANKNFTIKAGTTENPTNGDNITPTHADEGLIYTFDLSQGNYNYFVMTNGTNAGYLQSIIIDYVADLNINTVTTISSSQTYSNNIPATTCVIIDNNAVVTFTGTNNGTADNLIIKEGCQLIHESDVAATVQKNVAAYTAKDGDGWYLIATPVETIDKSVVAGTTYDLFLYSETDAMWYAHWDNPGFQTLNRGQGYLYANAEDKTINYAGTMKATNANINIDLYYTSTLSDAVRGFNLVGNPFTRNLVLGDMKLGGANLTTYYVTNTDRTALQAITSDAYQIKPGEGFFVQATPVSQQLSFNASSKDDIDFRYIKIVAGNENGYDNAYIQMGDCNTLRKMNIANKTEVYVMDGEDDYAAARVEELEGSMPVHFKAIADGEYTITIEAKYTDVYYMHLFDNFTGEDIDLMLEPSYTFHAAAEDAENRFLLVFDFNNHLSVNENYINDVFAYQYGDEIIINGEGELQIFDVMGRMVLNTKVNGVQSFNVPSNGVYILRIIGNDIKTQKIVVK